MMVRLKGESTPINFNRPKKVDKLNENKKKTSGLQIFPPIIVNGSSKINDDWKTRSCRDESQH